MLYISLATRGRPDRLVETVKRSSDNWTNPLTELHIQVDDDDAATIERCNKEGWLGSTGRIIANVKPREDTIAEKWNRIHTEGHGNFPGDVYLVAADDDPYVTPGYDERICVAAECLPDGVGWVYGHLANLSFTGALAATKGVCDILGFFLPTHFPYWFCDHWIDDVARISGRISFADVRTDQSKPGKTQEMREPAWWATFYDACYLMRREQAHRVMNSSRSCHHDALLLRNHPLVEVRSRLINEQVRQQSRQMEQWSGLSTQDERYQRVKARAIKTLGHALDDYNMPEAERAMFARYLFGQK